MIEVVREFVDVFKTTWRKSIVNTLIVLAFFGGIGAIIFGPAQIVFLIFGKGWWVPATAILMLFVLIGFGITMLDHYMRRK